MYVDYLRHCNRCRGHDHDEAFCFASREILWREVAIRFRDLCRENGGIYVKAGQHVCVQPISPEPFKEVLRSLMDQAQVRPFHEDRTTFVEDVGVDIEEAFASVDPVPVASASLAQVYKATTWKGEQVAVKIQQRPVARFLWIDLATMEAYYSLLSRLIPGLRFSWLATETRRHMSEELDFGDEARNADKIRETISNDIIIPRVYHALSGPRVLTQQWCDGVRVDDVDGLRSLRVDVRRVAKTIQSAFSRMIFVDGFVHCDPHPGNILVNAKGEVVLLDHGIYRTLPDDLRRTWCKMWRGLIRGSRAEMREATEALGVDPELTGFFSLVLALVPAKVMDDVHGTSTSSVVALEGPRAGVGGGSGGGGRGIGLSLIHI